MVLLRTVNGILRKLSVTDDTKLRGRIQMLTARVLPISEKSGVNLNGTYNMNKATQIEELDKESDLAETTNYEFYSKLWTLQKYIKNPITVR
jgi:THO complex subunit 1